MLPATETSSAPIPSTRWLLLRAANGRAVLTGHLDRLPETSQVMATVGGENVPVPAAVPQGQFVGLDQVNLGPLPRSLVGRGVVDIVLTVDDKQTNVLTVTIGPGASAVVVDNLATFLSLTGPNTVATFEDVAVGTINPTSGGISFANGEVNNLVIGPHGFWFGGASPTNFVGSVIVVGASFTTDVTAFGLNWSPFTSIKPGEFFFWELYDENTDLVAAGSYAIPASSMIGDDLFWGVLSDTAFRSVRVVGYSATNDGAYGAWFMGIELLIAETEAEAWVAVPGATFDWQDERHRGAA